MAIISADTFNPLKQYVAVRLQQGVPIIDADWNELEDVRKFELRAYLKWFIGDGVPEGNDGFRVAGEGSDDDFRILSGIADGGLLEGSDPFDGALRLAGRCLVDGLDVIITRDLGYRAQRLHASQPGAAALAQGLGVAVIPELPPAPADLLVYLDVWERLVTAEEEPRLLFQGLGTEGCARLKREWVVRCRAADRVPAPGESDHAAGHSYYAIARIRRGGVPIGPGDVTDLREQRLLVPPATLIPDALGTSVERYRRGHDRPPISLRAAVNALLRGDVPGARERDLEPDAVGEMTRSMVADGDGLVAVWEAWTSGIPQLRGSRLDLRDPGAGFGATLALTGGGKARKRPSVARLSDGSLVVAYEMESDVYCRRGRLEVLANAPELPVATSSNPDFAPTVLAVGDTVVFFHTSVTGFLFRRLRASDNTWIDPAPVQIPISWSSTSVYHAIPDGDRHVWFITDSGNVSAARLDVQTGNFVGAMQRISQGEGNRRPFLIRTADQSVHAFWANEGTHSIVTARFSGGSWSAPAPVPNTDKADGTPTVVEDAAGTLWLATMRPAEAGFNHLYLQPRDRDGGGWSPPRRLSQRADQTAMVHALVAPDGAVWMFWQRMWSDVARLVYRQLYTAI